MLSNKLYSNEAAAGPLNASGEEQCAAAAPPHAGFPFEVDPDDHCESPLEAYQDVAFLLHSPSCRTGNAAISSRSTSPPPILYDPYYCNGAVVQNLNRLGFDNVYNRNEDCYAVWSAAAAAAAASSTKSNPSRSSFRLLTFDALVTNPPYSSDHVEKLLQFVTSPQFGDRPWFLLLPNWVVKKDYYEQLVLSRGVTPFYVVPRKRYVYLPPPNYRTTKASDTHKKSSPFVSMWYVWGGTRARTDLLVKEYYRYQQQHHHQGKGPPTCDLARSKSALRDLRRKKR
jgi:hypothetical protein